MKTIFCNDENDEVLPDAFCVPEYLPYGTEWYHYRYSQVMQDMILEAAVIHK